MFITLSKDTHLSEKKIDLFAPYLTLMEKSDLFVPYLTLMDAY